MSDRETPGGVARLEWGDPSRPVDLAFLHANGFNARTYDALLAPLGADRRILAPDLRGHGATRLKADPARRSSWTDLVGDTVDLLEALEGPPVILAGHSMGATVALMAALRAPERVRGLVLLDPVILKRREAAILGVPGLWRLARNHPWARAARRRRSRFPDRETAFRSYRGRGAFKDWPDATLRDYLEAGLAPDGEGGLALTCDPLWEASGYGAQAHDPWKALDRLDRPIRILKAGRASPCSVTDADAARRPNLHLQTVADATHFFPMVAPEIAREALASL